MINFHEFVLNRRKEISWTQSRLAAEVGTSQHYISKIESGRVDVSLSMIQKIAGAMGYDLVLKITDAEKVEEAK